MNWEIVSQRYVTVSCFIVVSVTVVGGLIYTVKWKEDTSYNYIARTLILLQ